MIKGNKNKTKVKSSNKVRFTRRKKDNHSIKQIDKAMIIKPLGGFLPFPPLDCPYKEHIILSHGVPWIDLSIGHSCPNIKTCETRKEHLLKLYGGYYGSNK